MEDFDFGKWFRGAVGRLLVVLKWVLAIVGLSALYVTGTNWGLFFLFGVVCLVVVYIIENS